MYDIRQYQGCFFISLCIGYLSISDLHTVLNLIWETRLKWYNIGILLGIRVGTLDSIKFASRENVGQCFTEMVKTWLLMIGDSKPTWAVLADALKSPMVGYAHLSDKIKAEFLSGEQTHLLEEEKHIAAIEEAIENKGEIDHTAMQGVFLGPARSGKSTLIKRLLKEEIYQISPSTGAADKVIQVSIKKSSSVATSIFGSKWLRLTYSSEAVRIMMLTAKAHKKEKQPRSSSHPNQQGLYPLQSHPSTSLEMPAGYANPKATFEEALRDGGILTLREHFDGSWTLYISDTGGQMEFQEILPLLVSGPSLFFIVFPLNRDLDELFMIEYQLPDGERSQPYQSSLTLKEAILQSFSTISAMGTFTYKGTGREHVELKPKILLVGTHRDLLEQSTAENKIKKIDSFLQSTIKSMSFYREGLVEFADKDQLIFTVNNLADDDSDFDRIRSRVNQIADSGLYQMSIPTHWLIFSLVLRRSPDRVISYEECFQVAQQCGIDSEDELQNALWFLHTKIGVIRHFQHGDVSKIVIIDPQLLFDKITELIIKTFTFDKGTRLSQEFLKKGLFSFEDFSRINTTRDPHLTHLRFIDLLEHLRIVVPLPDRKRYLIPCVWTHADKALCPPKQHSAVPTLAIVFDCGYVPKGVTGSVVKYLMTNEMRSEFTWELQTDQIFCDQATFFVGPGLITLCMYPTHFEVVYAPSTKMAEAVCSIQEICREVCQTLVKAIHAVSKDINLACHCEPSFYCTLCRSHIAKLKQHEGMPCQMWCDKTPSPTPCDLPRGYDYWLEAPAKIHHAQSEALSSSTLTLPSALKLVLSLGAEWKNLGVFLNLDEGILNTIEYNYKKASDCLREMLSTWLKKVTPPPSWEMLAEAVDNFNETIAAKIREMYCTS